MAHDPDEPSDLSLYPSPSRVRRPKKWGLKYRRSKVLRSGVWLCTAVRDVAVPRKLSSTIPTIQLTSPAAEENPNWGFVLHPSLVAARSASRPSSRVVSTRTRLKTFNARSARSLSTTLAESYPSPWFTSRACRMTHGRAVTCRAFPRRGAPTRGRRVQSGLLHDRRPSRPSRYRGPSGARHPTSRRLQAISPLSRLRRVNHGRGAGRRSRIPRRRDGRGADRARGVQRPQRLLRLPYPRAPRGPGDRRGGRPVDSDVLRAPGHVRTPVRGSGVPGSNPRELLVAAQGRRNGTRCRLVVLPVGRGDRREPADPLSSAPVRAGVRRGRAVAAGGAVHQACLHPRITLRPCNAGGEQRGD